MTSRSDITRAVLITLVLLGVLLSIASYLGYCP
jgi:hypothetical protein